MFERSEFCTMMIVHYLLFGFFLCLDGLADRNRREKSMNSAAEAGRSAERSTGNEPLLSCLCYCSRLLRYCSGVQPMCF